MIYTLSGRGFNTQPPEGGCQRNIIRWFALILFQHTATRRWLLIAVIRKSTPDSGFNTQPPEGGCPSVLGYSRRVVSFNTQPPEGGCSRSFKKPRSFFAFQHTATRRWLLAKRGVGINSVRVSTHSHPKVAAGRNTKIDKNLSRFNTQPPEGGCSLHKKARKISKLNTVFR